MKAAIVILSDPKSGSEESLGRVFNALASAYDYKQKGEEVSILFQGAGTRWPAVLEKPDHRRIRINGDISRPTENTLQLGVREAFANCPKYITRRMVKTAATGEPLKREMNSGRTFGPVQEHLLGRGDVLFIATAHPTRGADASHRGGNPGFIEVLDEETLRIPDYVGNSMFNTLGNLVVDPAAGLVVPDFEHARALQLTGRAEVLFNSDDPIDATGGTHRFLVFHTDEWLQLALPAAVKTELLDYSPFNPPVVAT